MPLYLPNINREETSRRVTASFYGINKNLRCGDGEWMDMKNLTSDEAPVMSVRKRRGIPDLGMKPTANVEHRPTCITTRAVGNAGTYQPVWIDGTTLHEGKSVQIDLAQYGYRDNGTERTMVNMGAYLIVIPDMIYVNTTKPEDSGKIMDEFTSGGTWTVVTADYEAKEPKYVQATKPTGTEEDPIENGALWHKIGEDGGLFRYDEEGAEGEEWYSVASYLKITGKSGDAPIRIETKSPMRAGDTIRIDGIDPVVNKQSMVAKVDDGLGTEDFPTYVLVLGSMATAKIETTAAADGVTIKRVIPKMDFVCEANNRLWGCRYGDDGNGSFVNEIYCSARGDFFRWIAGAADNEDAPVTFSVGTDGVWTGAINYNGYPTFFKERGMHRVSGYGASGFSTYDTQCMGVARGAHKSMAVVKNVLYYKSASAIMGFDGSTPVPVSDALGRLHGYVGAVAGACGSKYYVSLWKMSDGTVKDVSLYSLDTDVGLWYREDETECESMAAAGDNLYFIAVDRKLSGVTHTIMTVEATEDMATAEMETDRITWYAETGLIGLETPDEKYLTNLAVRVKLDAGASIRVSVEYDSMTDWIQVTAMETGTMKTATVPIKPRRADHMRLRFEGIGGCKIFTITKTFETAEDR
jgi:hypothetical protein